jgi:hypothetical protein
MVTVSTALLWLIWLLFYATVGKDWLNESLGSGGESLLGPRNQALWTEIDLAAEIHGAISAVVLTLYGLAALFYVLARAKVRWYLRVVTLLIFYLGIEQLAAPPLAYLLGMNDYYHVRNVDHWPTSTNATEGWNSDSLRCRYESDEFQGQDLNLIFLGDSFTLGLGLYPDQTFPWKVERWLDRALPQTTVRVANFGWISASPLLCLRRLQALGEDYQPDHVVLCVDMTDFQDDLRYAAMLEQKGVYRLHRFFPLALHLWKTLSPASLRRFHYRSLGNPPRQRFFATESPLEETRPYLEVTVQHIREIHRWCEDRDLGFSVFLLPRSYQYSTRESPRNWEKDRYQILGPHSHAPFQFFAEKAPQLPFPIDSLLQAFQNNKLFPTCFEHDPHWNDNGTTVAAKAMMKLLLPRLQQQ